MIRKAAIKDIPIIVKLANEFLREHNAKIIKKNPKFKPYLKLKKESDTIFIKFLKKNIKSGLVLIAFVNGKPAGYCLGYIKKNIPIYQLEKLGYISDLYVKKKFRGTKIASKFKDEAIKWIRKKGIKHASLAVFCGNRFKSIYKKWGFFDYHIEMRKRI